MPFYKLVLLGLCLALSLPACKLADSDKPNPKANSSDCKPQPPKPDCLCATIYQPVCGCDGKTYGNACTAACENVRVVSEGECPQNKPQ